MFLPIGESTVIDRIFEELEADKRVDEVYVNTNERFASDFETHLENASFEKPRVSVEETTAEDEKFGVVGALAQLVDREGIDDDLLAIAGDNLISFDLSDFIDAFETNEAPTLAAYDVGSYEQATSYGIVELEDDRVVDFQEKPDEPKSTLVSIACYALPEESVSLFPTYLEDGNNPDEPGWFIQWLQNRTPTYAYTFDEVWFDIGTPESYLDAVAWKLDGESIVADDASVEETSIGENVHVMPGATLLESNLERSVVFPGVTLEQTSLRWCVVDRDAAISQLDLTGALIGAHITI